MVGVKDFGNEVNEDPVARKTDEEDEVTGEKDSRSSQEGRVDLNGVSSPGSW